VALRYKITFKLLYPDESASYEVSSLHGESKAIVIAARKHASSGKGHILSVETQQLEGEKPHGSDLVDRMEW